MQLRNRLGAFAFALVLLIVSTTSSFAAPPDDVALLWYLLFGGGAIGGAAAVGVHQRRKTAIRAQLNELDEIARTSAEADRDVNVTVFAPATAPPRAQVVIQAFVHLPDLESEVHAISLDADPGSIELSSI